MIMTNPAFSTNKVSPLRRLLLLKWPILPLLWRGQQQKSIALTTSAIGARAFFEEGSVSIPRDENHFSLCYRIYRDKVDAMEQEERSPSSERKHLRPRRAPLVVLHGGPSLPSQYLYPLVDHLTSTTASASEARRRRNVIFYDQLGCGKSDEPKDVKLYSIQKSVDDLQTVLNALLLDDDDNSDQDQQQGIHLFGHSYGGVLAYEYVKRLLLESRRQKPDRSSRRVLSLILANAPTSMALAGSEYDRLYAQNPVTFWNEHVCRKFPTPRVLTNALDNVGTVWSGMDVVLDWEATKPVAAVENDDDKLLLFPPTLVIGGKHDFASKASEGWTDIIPNAEQVTLENCAHYPHLEDGRTFGRLIEEFCERQEEGYNGTVEKI